MGTVEEIIKWLEYGISLSKWGINSLRDFPAIPKKGGSTNKGSDIGLSSKSTTTE
jgi:hypothetical protein